MPARKKTTETPADDAVVTPAEEIAPVVDESAPVTEETTATEVEESPAEEVSAGEAVGDLADTLSDVVEGKMDALNDDLDATLHGVREASDDYTEAHQNPYRPAIIAAAALGGILLITGSIISLRRKFRS